MSEKMPQEQVRKKNIHSSDERKIWRIRHFRGAIEGVREKQST